MTMEHWIEGQRRKGNDAGVKMGQTLLGIYGDIPFPSTRKPQKTTTPEQLVLRESFSEAEKEALIADGALIYHPSRPMEVAIYPAPDRFFVPGSFNKSVRQQEKLVEKDAQELRQRLSLEHITEIIPYEVSTLSDITFQHLDATGIWLFGPEYAKAQGLSWVYGRTKNPTNSTWSHVAYLGPADPDHGLHLHPRYRGAGLGSLGAVRLVVPIEAK